MFVSIFSPKGGVGKTTLSLALAEVLSQSRKTCIVEFDFSPGDFPSLLDINKDNNLLRAVKNDVRKTVQKPEKKNYYVITGGYPDTHERFTREEIDKLLMELDSNFEVSIFDIQPGLIENSVEVLKNSDKIVIITEDDKATVLRTARVLKWLENSSSISLNKVDIIVNKAASKLVNIPENIVTFKVPYYGFQLTFDSKNLLKHMEYYKKFILNEPVPRGFLVKPPEVKKVDPHDIQVFISTAVDALQADGWNEQQNLVLEDDIFVDYRVPSSGENISYNKPSVILDFENTNTVKRRNNMVYVKTHYETLNSVISKEINNVTDDFDKADILVVSSFSEDEIDRYVKTNKKIVLFTTPYYEDYARKRGIKYVFTEEASVSEIINAVEELLEEARVVDTAEQTDRNSADVQFAQQYKKDTPRFEIKMYSPKESYNERHKENTVFVSDTDSGRKETPVSAVPEANKKEYTLDDEKVFNENRDFSYKKFDDEESGRLYSHKPLEEPVNYEGSETAREVKNKESEKPAFSEKHYSFDSYEHIFEDFKKDILAVAAKYELIFKEESLRVIQEATSELKQKIQEALIEKEKTEKELEAVRKEMEQLKAELQARKEAALQLKKILANL
ncbi:AAA family ATPase [Thermoanaerobacter pentosaceus]|uniref:MinD-like ATPase involved in chromosome partitioning or flagellar assembly n=1 Tax=Thermoanaerobacter pentosaceus TaxID=694059 RepID=A0ABT9M2F8_9THEO|nr:AAA family ATPase [Thermoanaerobacter pentosaceus]MDP9750312.1 MinD-like ATPase involved in chromosome partitioning or flagellar assembly [Thermoanaerobacter pentosaceus]